LKSNCPSVVVLSRGLRMLNHRKLEDTSRNNKKKVLSGGPSCTMGLEEAPGSFIGPNEGSRAKAKRTRPRTNRKSGPLERRRDRVGKEDNGSGSEMPRTLPRRTTEGNPSEHQYQGVGGQKKLFSGSPQSQNGRQTPIRRSQTHGGRRDEIRGLV